MLGGVTCSYVTLDVLEKRQKFDYVIFILYRWLRFTPALIGTLLLYVLLPLMGSGPIYRDSTSLMSEPCERYFWRNLLYFNNFYDFHGNVIYGNYE